VLLDSCALDAFVEPLGSVDVGTEDVLDMSLGDDEVAVTPPFLVTEVPKVGSVGRVVFP
jgi:hypothetical protein